MKARWLFLGLGLLLVLVLTPLLVGFVRELIVVPALYVAWIVRLAFATLPQTLIWGLFLLIALLVGIGTLVSLSRPSLDEDEPVGRHRGPLAAWWRWVDLATQESYSNWRLARRIGNLAQDLFSHTTQLTPEEIKARVEAGEMEAPPDVEAYLQAAMATRSYRAFERPGWRFCSSDEQTAPLDADLEDVAAYLERELEVQGDR